MNGFLVELFVIAILIMVNGFFACAEFAIVSIRKSRVAQMIANGDQRAKAVETLQDNPHRLLAIVQIGVTVVGSSASAVGGIVAITHLKPILESSSIELLHNGAEAISITCVVAILSYFLLVIGELVPKTIGLQYADPVALHVARPLEFMAKLSGLFIWLLSISSRGVLALFRIKGKEEGFITREEIQHIIAEGHEAGAFTAAENEYIKNIFDFTHTTAREVMVPRTRMAAISDDESNESIASFILANQYSRYPVYRDTIEQITGFIHAKDFLGKMVLDPQFDFAAIVRPPLFIPEGKRVNDLLKEMQRKRIHMAMVVDEYGGISGMVTTEDLLEELVGEIEDEHDVGEPSAVQALPYGAFLVDALLSVNDLEDLLKIKIEEDMQFDTLAGLILQRLGRFPEKGEQVKYEEFLFTCEEVARNAIVRVKIEPTSAGMVINMTGQDS